MLVKEWRWSVSAVVVVLWWADADHHSRQLLCYACEGMALVSVTVVVVLWWADADHHSRQLLCYACEGMALVSVSSGSGAVVG